MKSRLTESSRRSTQRRARKLTCVHSWSKSRRCPKRYLSPIPTILKHTGQKRVVVLALRVSLVHKSQAMCSFLCILRKARANRDKPGPRGRNGAKFRTKRATSSPQCAIGRTQSKRKSTQKSTSRTWPMKSSAPTATWRA